MIEIPPHELGTTRVFALSLTEKDAAGLRDSHQRQCAALGAADLNPKGVEVFKVSDLGELGLIGYLREGVDAPEDDLTRDGAKLAALGGWVMLVHSSAFEGKGTTLEPNQTLTLIGTYVQVTPDTPPVSLESEAAKPYSGTAAIPSTARPRSRFAGALVALLVIIVAILSQVLA